MDKTLYEAATQDFNLPHDIVTLPSGGIFYKSKKKSVKVGYLTAADENFLLSVSRNPGQNIIYSLLRNKMYEHDLRPDELIDGDVQAILIFLRNTSFGSEYVINLVDPKTDKQFSTSINLDTLNIKKCEHKPNEEGHFIVTLPKTGDTVKLKILTMSDIVEIDKILEQYPQGRTTPTITLRLSKQILEVNGNTDKGVIAQYVENLPISDSKFIRNFLKDNQPSLDLQKSVIAPSGELVTFEVTFGAEFFRPFF